MARVSTGLIVGRTRVATESRHLLGPVEGTWWKKYSWWVIPLAVLLLVWPGWLHQGFSWLAGAKVAGPSSTALSPLVVSAPAPVIVPPLVVTTPAPSISRVDVEVRGELKLTPPPTPLPPKSGLPDNVW